MRFDDHIVLGGLPTLQAYLEWTDRDASGAEAVGRNRFTQQWERAHGYFQGLQQSEAGWADDTAVLPLPESMQPYAQAAFEDPVHRRHAAARSQWALVELDRLVVYQKFINVTYANSLRAALPRTLSDKDVVQLAINPAVEPASIRCTQLSPTSFAFLSESGDMRFVEAALLEPQMLRGYQSRGRASKVLGLFIGMSVNFLTALKVGSRLILADGSHRAYALRKSGITHAPCVVEHLDSAEELEALNLDMLEEERSLILHAPRPALFKDYFDPRMFTPLHLAHRKTLVNVRIILDRSKTSDL